MGVNSLSSQECLLYDMIKREKLKGLLVDMVSQNNESIKSLKKKGLIIDFVNNNKDEVYIANQFINWERFTIKDGIKKFKKISKGNGIWISWSSNESSNITPMIGIIERICYEWGFIEHIPSMILQLMLKFLHSKRVVNMISNDFETFDNLFGDIVIQSKIKCKRKYSYTSDNDGILSIFGYSVINNSEISAKGCGVSTKKNRVILKKEKLHFGASNFWSLYGGGIIIIHCHTLTNNGSINADGGQRNTFASIGSGKSKNFNNAHRVCGGSILIVCKKLININGSITCDGDYYGKLSIYCDELSIKNGNIKGYTYMEGSYLNGLILLQKMYKYPEIFIGPICNEMDYTLQELKEQIFTDNDLTRYQHVKMKWNNSNQDGIIIRNTKKDVTIHWIGKHKSYDVNMNKKEFYECFLCK